MDQKLIDKLDKRIEEGTYRSLSSFEGHVDFWSNDYLGFAKKDFPISKSEGGTGSRLISGNSSAAEKCEETLAHFFEVESALVFNSGYNANLGFFGCIPQKGDTVIYDAKIHASVKDGLRISFANSHSFIHNDSQDLKKKIKQAEGTVYVVVEALYSMDGDMAPLGRIHEVCQEENAYLIIDEAHSCGVYGQAGKGISGLLQNDSKVLARIVTFGKAYGWHGAAVLCSTKLKEFLINFSRPFIYTTALPASDYEQIELRVTSNDVTDQQNRLHQNIQFFRENFQHKDLVSEVNSPIQILRFSTNKNLEARTKKILDRKMAIKPILAPTVKAGDEGLRICIHSFNTESEILALIKCLNS
jgi:8-amino-7-oxononanoate synthase